MLGILLGSTVLLMIAGIPTVPESVDVEVRRVSVPVLLEDRQEGGCADPQPNWFRLYEDGQEVEIRAIERKRLETVHVLLVDSSGSMLMDTGGTKLNRMQVAAAAAGHYVASLPPDDRVILATFADRLVMWGEMPAGNYPVEDILENLAAGQRTALWDSLHQLIAYLQARHDRIVLLALSDGCDQFGIDSPTPREVIELAEESENLTVFTIGISLPRICRESPAGRNQPVIHLRQLAEAAGGKFYSLEYTDELLWVLPEIREMLGREGYVIYQPVPFGQAPQDRPEIRDFKYRKVKIRTSKDSPCEMAIAGTPLRFESAEGEAGREREATPAHVQNVAFQPLGVEGRFVATITDVTRDAGILYREKTYRSAGKYRERGSARIVRRQRRVMLHVPPFDEVVAESAGPANVLLRALSGYEPGESENDSWEDVPFLVHGRTFLEIRGALARTLFDIPGYRRWAYRKIRDERLRKLEYLFSDSTPEALRTCIERMDWQPEPWEVQKYLAAWLGDLPAAGLAASLDLELIRQPAPEIAESWQVLSAWFPPPFKVQQLALLIVGYDPDLDRIGFYRVTLPHLVPAKAPRDLVPDAPYGLMFHDWLAGYPEARSLMADGTDLLAIHYDKPSSREMRKARGAVKRKGDLQGGPVTLMIGDDFTTAVPVRAYFGDRKAPSCIVMDRDDTVEGTGARILEVLTRIVEQDRETSLLLL